MNLNFNHLLLLVLIVFYYAAPKLTYEEVSNASSAISQEDMDSFSTTTRSDFSEASLMMADTVICRGDLIVLDGIMVNTEGSRAYTFTDINGNDSLGMINVVVLDPIIDSDTEEICFGENFLGQTTSGSFRDTIRYVNGCDSLITNYRLTVFPKIDTTFRDTVILCDGESYDRETPSGIFTIVNDPPIFRIDDRDYIYQSVNGCDSVVNSRIIQYRDLMSTVKATICGRDTFFTDDGQKLTEEGIHPVVYQSSVGCDSTILIDLSVGISHSIDTTYKLCEGQSIFLSTGEEIFDGSGTDQFRTSVGCDSIINFRVEVTETIDTSRTICLGETFTLGGIEFTESTTDFLIESSDSTTFCNGSFLLNLTVLDCSLTPIIDEGPLLMCSDDKNGRFSFSLAKGNFPFTYQWQFLDTLFEGTLDTLLQPIEAEGLPAGTYTITVTDVRLMTQEFDVTIRSPEFWSHTADESDYNGFNVSCAGGEDGVLEIFPVGGMPPYTYQWSNGASTQKVSDLTADSIVVTVTDAVNCDYQALFQLTEPDSLNIEIDSMKPSCDSLPTGLIEVVFGEGGVEPYEYSIQGIGNSVRGQFENLAPGSYTLIATDENGCMQEFPTDLPGPDIPELVFNKNEFSELATPVMLDVQSNVELDIIEWSMEEGLSCYDCLTPDASPNQTTTYTITAISFDGCETSEEITVNIEKKRDVYVPNIFSPNGDGLNDRFTVFGGPEVVNVLYFQVYSRWGDLVYDGLNLPVNDSFEGWDGTMNGQRVSAGNYIWIARILFVDGEEFEYSGTVALK